MKDKKHNRPGSTTNNPKAHQSEHRNWSRRNFLKNLGLAGGASALLGGVPVSALAGSRWAGLSTGVNDRAVVIIRLSGGNDGLNTIIPLNQYDTYANARPTLRIPQNQTWNLSDEYAMPDYMSDLQPMWEEGQMKVLHNVGYADQNLSHFRSTDIWESTSDPDVSVDSGWLGRLAMNQYPDLILNPPDHPVAIQIGASGSLTFNNEDSVNVAFSVSSPEYLEEIAQTGELYDPLDVSDCYSGEQLSFMRITVNNTFKYAEIIPEVYANASNSVTYEGRLGEQLAILARLIKGGLQTKMYLISLGGFDTHAQQSNAHVNLLNQVASQIKLFYEDLAAGEKQDDVLTMTVSEFGRRIEENGSAGTDHGAAAPLLMFGPGLEGSGFIGDGPDLSNTDDIGNLQYETDFRSVYASVLENWLCIEPDTVDTVMGGDFTRLDLGFNCDTTPIFNPQTALPELESEVRYLGDGSLALHYNLPYGGDVQVDVFNILGQKMQTLHSGYQFSGAQVVPFRPTNRIPSSTYILRVTLNGKGVSKKVRVVR